VVDTLPAGISLESLWTGNMIYAPTSYPITIGKNGTLSGNRGDVAITGSLVKNQDGTQTVTLIFTPKNGTTSQSWFQNYTGSGDNFHIIYCCSIGEDAKNYPQAGEMATLSFTNQVQVYYDKDQAKAAQAANTIQAAIDRRPEVKETLEKTGTWDNASKTLGYEIQLNPYGADLVADTDTLEVVDTLIYPKSASKSVSLLMNSMELYEAELGEDDQGYPKIVQGNKVDALNWSWKVLESDQVINGREMEVSQITASVPDSMALILKYKYLVMQEEEGQLDITNTVAIKGTVYEVSLDSNSQDGWVNSYAGVTVHVTAALTMYKVDEQNYEITLEDSRFAIFGYEEGSWEDTGMVLTTDSSGRFSVSANVFQDDIEEETMEGTTPVLKKNKAYYLQEIQPPGGYDLPESPPKYGFYYDEDQTTGDYPHGWESSTGFSRVVNLARESATEYVENSRKTMAVSVTKTWEMNGEVTTAHPNRLSVTLKQYAVKRTTADRLVEQGKTLSEALATLVDREDEDCWLVETAARTLSDGNKRNDQWVYTWESLPVSGLDPDHDDVEVYYYYLIEEDSPQGWESQSQVVYGTDEEGGETQRTDFVNSMTGYLLPSTGGVTSELFELLGFLILTAGLVTAWYRKKTEGRNKNTR
jgi:LPXTG-motif cell wall-anchored protein